jgi:hypothetical protein
MAGVPSIMQAMLGEVAPKLKIGVRMLSETVRADAREGDIGMQLGEIAKANSAVAIGNSPFFNPQQQECGAPAMQRSSRRPNARSRTCWSGGKHSQIAERRPLTAKTGVPQFPHLQLFSNGQCSNCAVERNLRRDTYLNPGNPQDARVSSLRQR